MKSEKHLIDRNRPNAQMPGIEPATIEYARARSGHRQNWQRDVSLGCDGRSYSFEVIRKKFFEGKSVKNLEVHGKSFLPF